MPYARAVGLYAEYVALMLAVLSSVDRNEYERIQDVYIQHSDVDSAVMWWYLYDLAPLLFELCLLGKHGHSAPKRLHGARVTA